MTKVSKHKSNNARLRVVFEDLVKIKRDGYKGAYRYLTDLQLSDPGLIFPKVWKFRQSVAVKDKKVCWGYGEWDRGLHMVACYSVCFTYIFNHIAHRLKEIKMDTHYPIYVFDHVAIRGPRFF